ncbi:MAG: acetyl-CoA carboxylase biotin carboxyl carrier protein subunit [Rhodobacteraceae bacterium]|nr:MAG: acetyl-CoA carboxylase biotin carboxyl carrier protein subunit [Paracoccaceae bacterium]
MSDKLTHSDIEDIMALVESSSFDQLNLEMGDMKLSLRRSGASDAAPIAATVPSPVAAPSPTAVAPTTTPPVSAPSDGATNVNSEMLGTFYHAPKPGEAPFVSVGSTVTSDTVIGIIEVMKLMTSVTAGIDGTVTQIIAPDGELVEHGQVLIRVKQS